MHTPHLTNLFLFFALPMWRYCSIAPHAVDCPRFYTGGVSGKVERRLQSHLRCWRGIFYPDLTCHTRKYCNKYICVWAIVFFGWNRKNYAHMHMYLHTFTKTAQWIALNRDSVKWVGSELSCCTMKDVLILNAFITHLDLRTGEHTHLHTVHVHVNLQ